MNFILLLFPLLFAEESYESAVKKCQDQVVWGYFLQDVESIKQLGGRYDFWKISDLKGKFKSQDECEKSKVKLKHAYLAEKCEGYYLRDIDLVLYGLKIKKADGDISGDSVYFDSKSDCDFFRSHGLSQGLVRPANSDGFPRLSGDCRADKIKLCSKHGQKMKDIKIFGRAN